MHCSLNSKLIIYNTPTRYNVASKSSRTFVVTKKKTPLQLSRQTKIFVTIHFLFPCISVYCFTQRDNKNKPFTSIVEAVRTRTKLSDESIGRDITEHKHEND